MFATSAGIRDVCDGEGREDDRPEQSEGRLDQCAHRAEYPEAQPPQHARFAQLLVGEDQHPQQPHARREIVAEEWGIGEVEIGWNGRGECQPGCPVCTVSAREQRPTADCVEDVQQSRGNVRGADIQGMEFEAGTDAESLGLDGTETFSLLDLDDNLQPGQVLSLTISRTNGLTEKVPLRVRIDTSIEVEYYRHGGILPFVLRQILKES